MKAGQVVLLAAAGFLAFFAAMSFNSGNAANDGIAGEVVASVERMRPAVQTSVTAPSERLNSMGASHNPFGTLNLPTPPASASLGTPKVDISVQKKAEAAARARARWAEMGPPIPPPPPVAPPLPFTAVGAISGAGVTDGKMVAFIKQQDQLLLVRTGDAIGQSYRVESVTSQKVEFTYLPLMQRQVLAFAP